MAEVKVGDAVEVAPWGPNMNAPFVSATVLRLVNWPDRNSIVVSIPNYEGSPEEVSRKRGEYRLIEQPAPATEPEEADGYRYQNGDMVKVGLEYGPVFRRVIGMSLTGVLVTEDAAGEIKTIDPSQVECVL
jgi:hypothetical protein